jgi:hypothetical protein
MTSISDRDNRFSIPQSAQAKFEAQSGFYSVGTKISFIMSYRTRA